MPQVATTSQTDGLLSHRIAFRDFFGARFALSANGLVHLFIQPYTQIYTLLCFVLLVATDVPGLLGHVSIATVFGCWILFLSLFHGLIWLQLTVYAYLCRHGLSCTYHRSMLFTLALIPTVGIGEWLILIVSDGNNAFGPILPQGLIYLIVSESFGVMFFSLIYPQLYQDQNPEPSPAPEPPVRHVVIGAEPVPIDQILLLEAREHHVHVTMRDSDVVHRTRLSDVVAQTQCADGVQPHRSWWVARNQVSGIEQDGQKTFLRLHDGKRLPVARTRHKDVMHWLDHHK